MKTFQLGPTAYGARHLASRCLKRKLHIQCIYESNLQNKFFNDLAWPIQNEEFIIFYSYICILSFFLFSWILVFYSDDF